MMEIQFCIIDSTCTTIWMTCTINASMGNSGEASNGKERRGKPLENLT
jgi:hypothetical protein